MASLEEARDLYSRGMLDAAEARCRAILAQSPRHFDVLCLLGVIKLRQRAAPDACRCFEQAVAINPESVDALANLAFLQLILTRADDALATCTRALAVAPSHVATWVTRGNALFRAGRLEDALASLDQALALDGGNLEALIARGTVLASLRRDAEAVAAFDRIPVDRDPVDLRRRADLLQSLGLLTAAARDYRRLTGMTQHALAGWIGLARCAQERCDWDALEEPRRRVLAAVDAGVPIDPLLVLRLSSDPAQQLRAARRVAPRATPAPPRRAETRTRPPRLRIAYLSPDFRIHPLAYLIAELLERHDRRRFEVIGVSLGPPDGSDIRARIVRAFDQFHDVHAHSDDDAATLLRGLDIDLALDLAGYTQHARHGILARRIAPIQASYLGYCGTSGSDFIDYLLADRIAVPPEQQPFFTEKLAYLPDTFMVADSTQPIAPTTPARRECGLPDDGFVFCCFNKSYKISEPTFAAWMRLLRAVDGSVVWLSDHPGERNDGLRRNAQARGVDPERLVFAPNVAARADHFARHRLADLFLDTLPYNAHTTACDALFAGLPVLTVSGPTFAGRVAASLLRAHGLDELVTRSLEQYEATARDLARDPARMQAIRAKAAANRRTHPLFDTDRFRANIEAAYDRMWDIFQRGEPPRTFDVADE
jgi:predicted O-linked N-acetylglucosamine transferase (SPINDLY family)